MRRRIEHQRNQNDEDLAMMISEQENRRRRLWPRGEENQKEQHNGLAPSELPAKESLSPFWLPLSFRIQQLKRQHEHDLAIYRRNHKEYKNRIIHWIMIPLECWSALLLFMIILDIIRRQLLIPFLESCAILLSFPAPTFDSFLERTFPIIVMAVGVGLGFLPLAISTQMWIGVACAIFHVIAVLSCYSLILVVHEASTRTADTDSYCQETVLLTSIGVGTWTVAWIFQVGLGHWICEKNQPNVANMDEVSWLAMVQSVLIAWSS